MSKRLFAVTYYVEIECKENEEPSDDFIVDECEKASNGFSADFATVDEVDNIR